MPDVIASGGCLCGQCRYQSTSTARYVVKCYCRDCQSASGGGHMPQAAYTAADVDLTGPVTRYLSTADSGNALEFTFCSTCGSPLAKTTSGAPDTIYFTLGTHDDASALSINHTPFEDARQPWDS